MPSLTNSTTGFYDGPEINVVSCSADTYTVTGLAKRTVATDMTQLGYLRQMVKSKGVKMFYYSSTTDGYRDLTDTWGATTTAYATDSTGGFTSGTTPVIFVRVKRMSVRQTADSTILRYTIELVETT